MSLHHYYPGVFKMETTSMLVCVHNVTGDLIVTIVWEWPLLFSVNQNLISRKFQEW